MSAVRSLEDYRREPVGCVVDILKEALERAEKGELTACVIAYETSDESNGHAMAWGRRSAPMSLVGELALIQTSIFIGTGRMHK